jgi:ribosome biogenesis GTPase A
MVLDARDPLGCRPTEVEQYIQQKDPNKRIILVLNKIDLVPKVKIHNMHAYTRERYIHMFAYVACNLKGRLHKYLYGYACIRTNTSNWDGLLVHVLYVVCMHGIHMQTHVYGYAKHTWLFMASI